MTNAERQARHRALRNAHEKALAEENARLRNENALLRVELDALRNGTSAAPPKEPERAAQPLRNGAPRKRREKTPDEKAYARAAAKNASVQEQHFRVKNAERRLAEAEAWVAAHDGASNEGLYLAQRDLMKHYRRLKKLSPRDFDDIERRARAAVQKAHPDKGGSTEAFMHAKSRLDMITGKGRR